MLTPLFSHKPLFVGTGCRVSRLGYVCDLAPPPPNVSLEDLDVIQPLLRDFKEPVEFLLVELC